MVLAGAKGYLALLVGTWAYYHVVRQHYGFMVMYKVKNRDTAPLDNSLDRWFLRVMLIFPPFHRFFVHHPEELGLPFAFSRWEWVALGRSRFSRRASGSRGKSLDDRAERPFNVPKWLLLAGVIPLHWLTFAYMSWQAAVPTVTIVHNLQYHALVWFHNRNRYGAPDSGERHGRIPREVSRSLLAYAGMALLFSMLYRIPGFHAGPRVRSWIGFVLRIWLDALLSG